MGKAIKDLQLDPPLRPPPFSDKDRSVYRSCYGRDKALCEPYLVLQGNGKRRENKSSSFVCSINVSTCQKIDNLIFEFPVI